MAREAVRSLPRRISGVKRTHPARTCRSALERIGAALTQSGRTSCIGRTVVLRANQSGGLLRLLCCSLAETDVDLVVVVDGGDAQLAARCFDEPSERGEVQILAAFES